MKRFSIALTALLGSSAALAAIPSTDPTGTVVPKDPYTLDSTMAVVSADPYAGRIAAQNATLQQWAAAEPVAYTADEAALKTVAETSKAAALAADADAMLAAKSATPPAEPVEAAADLTPRPATQNYPACSPGPGDDNCIQLYEPGVEQQLAAWSQPTGGFAGSGDAQVAMGGPYEPAEAVPGEAERMAAADELAAHEELAMADSAYRDSPTDDVGVMGL